MSIFLIVVIAIVSWGFGVAIGYDYGCWVGTIVERERWRRKRRHGRDDQFDFH